MALSAQPPTTATASANPTGSEDDLEALRGGERRSNLSMIGDLSPILLGRPSAVGPPAPPGHRGSALFYPSVRTFKISENQSPRPQDRVYFDFNYWNNLNAAVNQAGHIPITNINAYRYLFGVEKTFDEGRGSVGIRLPLDDVTADSPGNIISTPTSTALDNLTVFAKYILEEDRRTGSLVSVGLAVTPPTGPSRFANAPYLFGINSVYIQPFIGYIYNAKRWYIQGFSGFDLPTNAADVVLMYNDVGIGYYLLRSTDPTRFLSAVAPTFEVHVDSPLNHRNPFNAFDIAGTQNVVNLTYGVNFELCRQAVLTIALITPVSSPKPFDAEAALLLNFYFGRTRARRLAITPPPAS